MVTWSPPTDVGAGLVSYVISTEPPSTGATVPATRTTASLSGLSPDLAYTVQVRAFDSIGSTSPPASTSLVNGVPPTQSASSAQFLSNGLHTGQTDDPGPSNGTTTWTWTDNGNLAPSSVVIGRNGDVYVETSTGIAVLSPGDHHVLWQANFKYSSGTAIGLMIVAPDGGLYVGGYNGDPNDVALLAPGGTVRWQTVIPNPTYGLQGINLVGDTVYVEDAVNDTVRALDANTGSIDWTDVYGRASCGCEDSPAPAPDGSTIYAVADQQIVALTPGPHGGQVHWRYTFAQGEVYGASSPTVGADGTIYIDWCQEPNQSGLDNVCGIQAINPDGTLKWKHTGVGSDLNPVTSTATGLVVVGDGYGNLDALDADTGQLIWSFQNPGTDGDTQIDGAATVARDGTIYVESEQDVFALSNTGHVLWSAPENSGPANTGWGSGVALGPSGTLYATITDPNNNIKLIEF